MALAYVSVWLQAANCVEPHGGAYPEVESRHSITNTFLGSPINRRYKLWGTFLVEERAGYLG